MLDCSVLHPAPEYADLSASCRVERQVVIGVVRRIENGLMYHVICLQDELIVAVLHRDDAECRRCAVEVAVNDEAAARAACER